MQLGDLNGAIAECSHAVLLNPSDPNTLTGMGRVFSAQGKFDEAVNSFQAALQLNSGWFDAQYWPGGGAPET